MDNEQVKNRTNFASIFVIILILLSVAVNLFFLFRQSIRLDEAQSIWVSTKSVPAILKIDGQDVQVPLYTLLLHFWLQIFGTDISISRVLSLIFYVATIPLLYLFIKRVSNDKIAFLGIVLFAFSPFISWYSYEARTYTIFTFLITLNNLYFFKMLKSSGNNGKFIFLLSAILGIYTHYFFLFFLLTQALYVLYLLIFSYLKQMNVNKNLFFWFQHENLRKFYTFYFLISIISFISFMPWFLYLVKLGFASNTQPVLPRPNSYSVIQLFANFIFGFQNPIYQALVVALWPLLVILLFIVFTRKSKDALSNVGYFLTMTFVPVFLIYFSSLFLKPIFLARYLIFVTPTLFALLAWLIVNYSRKYFILVSLAILGILLFFLFNQNNSPNTPEKESYQSVVSYLNSYTSYDDIVAVSAPFTVYPIEYYYTGKAKIVTIPFWNRYVEGGIPAFTTSELKSQVADYKKVYRRMFVVLSYNQGYESQIKNYLDQNLAILTLKKYPANISLTVYKLRYDIK